MSYPLSKYMRGQAPICLLLLRFLLFDDLHHAAGAEAGSAKLDELFRILQRRDAAGGLDPHAGLSQRRAACGSIIIHPRRDFNLPACVLKISKNLLAFF